MKNIDFLPDIYRHRTELAHARIWWGIVVVIFSTAIGSTAGAQYLLRQSIQRQIDELEIASVAAQRQVQLLTQLQQQNRTSGELAGLVTYLEHPWPRTQLLAELLGPLPPSIRLTELVVAEEETLRSSAPEPGQRRRGQRPDDSQQAKLSPPLADLETLRRQHDHKQPVIEITGTLADVAILHEYVTDLGRSPLVGRAQIKSLESTATGEQAGPTQFTLRLVFSASHAQPGPPGDKPANPAQAAAQRNRSSTVVARGKGSQ
ncbi:MAG: hypothetical protein WD872_14665 [Pirellulaceae bacterium]